MSVLVIAEKNLAARRIAYFLSDGKMEILKEDGVEYYSFFRNRERYYVVGLKGHIVELDYPPEYSAWDEFPEKLIDVEPIKVVRIENIAKLLKKLSKEVKTIILATDYDREGELIGVEALELMNIDPRSDNVKRARFSSITREEIKRAFENTTKVDLNLAKAAEIRQKIDLLWGAVLTRYLSVLSGRRGKEFISAGRVQSPTLSLIVDREREIEKFEKKPYWKITIDLDSFSAQSETPIYDEGEARKIFESISKIGKVRVLEFKKEISRISRPSPFNTTLFLKACNDIGISVGKSMKIAEDLYIRGYISYPRTDNTTYSQQINIKEILKKLIDSDFSKEARELIEKDVIRPSSGKYDTKDHPPIHPVRGARRAEMPELYWKVYELVVRRFLATIAEDAIVERREAVLECNGVRFTAVGKKILEKGWMKYYPYTSVEESYLPELREGTELKIVDINIKKNYTKPPPRYSQGTLVEEMERLGLGTKSTRHEIIDKLIERGFIRAGRTLRPTRLGSTVAVALKENVEEISKPDMTAKLERAMDLIADGKINPNSVYDESREILRKIIIELKNKSDNIKRFLREGMFELYGECPGCGGKLLEDRNYVRCESCGQSYRLPSSNARPTSEKCPECSLPIVEVIRGKIREKRCLNNVCRYNIEKDTLGDCPVCGNRVVVRWSSEGKRFAGCTAYPKCNFTASLPQRGKIIPVGKSSDGNIIVEVIERKRRYQICLKKERKL